MSASAHRKLSALCVICSVAWGPDRSVGVSAYAPGEILVQWSATAAKPSAASSLAQGIEQARESIDSGAAAEKLDALVRATAAAAV